MQKLRLLTPEVPIVLILDNARDQKCMLVWMRARDLKIELLYLPPYSPNLNLIERLWKFVKKNVCTQFTMLILILSQRRLVPALTIRTTLIKSSLILYSRLISRPLRKSPYYHLCPREVYLFTYLPIYLSPCLPAQSLLLVFSGSALHYTLALPTIIIGIAEHRMSTENPGDGDVPAPLPDYPDLFRQYVARSVAITYAAVAADPITLADEIRTQALHVLSFALRLAEAWPATRDLLLLLAPKMEKAGYRDDWIPYLKMGLQQSHVLGDTTVMAELNLQVGLLYQLRAQLAQAYHYYQASAICFATTGDTHNQARALNQQAFVAWLQRRHAEALQLTDVTLQLLPENDVRRATGYVVRGWIAIDNHDFEVAERYFTQALQLWQAQGDQRQIARRLRDLADVLQLQEHYQAAIDYYTQAIDLFTGIQDRFELAVTQINLGVIYLLHQQMEKALRCFAATESVFRQLQDHLNLANVYTNQGIAYRNLGQFTRSIAVLHKSIELFVNLNRTDRQVNALDELGMSYLAAGKVSEATVSLEQALTCLQKMEKEPGYRQQWEAVHAHLQLTLCASV